MKLHRRRRTRRSASPPSAISASVPGSGVMALTDIVANQTHGAERFDRMKEFFEGVGGGDVAGYGWNTKPVSPPGFKDKLRRAREARAKASEAIGA